MNNSVYLKRCPMCGSRARLQATSLHGMYAVVCDCSSHIFFGCGYDRKKVAAAWNKRVGE